ncbi:hypothetical protein AT730_25805 (plasmid) [Vibrio alginolyticus]|nr:hypothetical protein AT730_25805 [Vibrio alginolyticus]APX09842.1 hypothetical protein BWP24_26890 [Vibrio campbellii]EGR1442786.1 hypothetical protein [Vibrio parahaemolyticus]OOH98474.1 hypothetical protein BIW16_19165 [Vibrio sp. OULL4]ARR10213.1 hypothetical protein Vc3S01_p20098 [Vibrio campbellii]
MLIEDWREKLKENLERNYQIEVSSLYISKKNRMVYVQFSDSSNVQKYLGLNLDLVDVVIRQNTWEYCQNSKVSTLIEKRHRVKLPKNKMSKYCFES